MKATQPKYKREILNQSINFFWTILCFAPVILVWIGEGIHLKFYLSLAMALLVALLPDKILNLFLFSSGRRFYESLGVRFIRKWVQNGDAVNAMTNGRGSSIIKGVSQAKKYLKTIAMYERYHWACFIFFVLTAILSFAADHFLLGLVVCAANVLYNGSSILLQQYNKIRITKMID